MAPVPSPFPYQKGALRTIFVDCRQLFVDVYLLFLAQRIQDSCHIAGIYKPA